MSTSEYIPDCFLCSSSSSPSDQAISISGVLYLARTKLGRSSRLRNNQSWSKYSEWCYYMKVEVMQQIYTELQIEVVV